MNHKGTVYPLEIYFEVDEFYLLITKKQDSYYECYLSLNPVIEFELIQTHLKQQIRQLKFGSWAYLGFQAKFKL